LNNIVSAASRSWVTSCRVDPGVTLGAEDHRVAGRQICAADIAI